MLDVKGLEVVFGKTRRSAGNAAVDGVDFSVGPGEILGIIGESGSGKSTIGRVVLGLTPPTQGSVAWLGEDITAELERGHGTGKRGIQAVFQDPYGSLNPYRTIGDSVREPALAAGINSDWASTAERLQEVRLPEDAIRKFPHAFSGGQRQRIAIARALSVSPRLIVCDEATSALDVVTQASVVNLLSDLRRQDGVSLIFIAHNLSLVAHVADRVIVLYRGRIMEQGAAAGVRERPLHPYTRALVDAIPVPDRAAQIARRAARANRPKGGTNVSIPVGVVPGCPFAARCPAVAEVCISTRPRDVAVTADRKVACHQFDSASGHPAPVRANDVRDVAVRGRGDRDD